MLRVSLLALAAGLALAACPNQCSGHGTCSQNDICTCYSNWQGPDCSLRTCAFGNSWALDNANPHAYEECSGAGLCDRATGECKCFDGFSGYACQRRACPNDCSGHGVCRMLSEIDTEVPYPATAWDADHIQACVCDAGYFGNDCSQRRCPTGDDPLTLCDNGITGQVQEIRVRLGSEATGAGESMDIFGTSDAKTRAQVLADPSLAQLRVGYTDVYGAVYFAPAAAKGVFATPGASDVGAQSLEMVLENIPGFKVHDVTVAAETVTAIPDVLEKRYLVSFVPDESSSANYGLQAPLVCDSGYTCTTPGCAPLVRMPFLYRYAATKDPQGTLDAAIAGFAGFDFFTGADNAAADFSAGSFVRLDASSAPRLPLGVSPNDDATAADPNRYDIRVVVAVQDPEGPNTDVDVFWTKVVYQHTNIKNDPFEWATGTTGQFSAAKAAEWQGTLNGFTYRGFIPADKKASIPDAPGVVLSFPSRDLIDEDAGFDQNFKFFEILVKLPTCAVTPMYMGTEFTGLSGAAITRVSSQVENIECSNRGQCNRETGLCQCFQGYTGIACSRQTALV